MPLQPPPTCHPPESDHLSPRQLRPPALIIITLKLRDTLLRNPRHCVKSSSCSTVHCCTRSCDTTCLHDICLFRAFLRELNKHWEILDLLDGPLSISLTFFSWLIITLVQLPKSCRPSSQYQHQFRSSQRSSTMSKNNLSLLILAQTTDHSTRRTALADNVIL